MTTAPRNLYLVVYDISDPKRWKAAFRKLCGYGEWVQLSVFQCRLARAEMLEMETDLRECLNQVEDHLLIVDIGGAENIKPRIRTIGREFVPVKREAVIV